MLLPPLCYVFMLRTLANHLPVGFGGSSRTQLLRHIHVPACERDGQRRGAIRAGHVDVHSRRSDQPLRYVHSPLVRGKAQRRGAISR
jgi:hypothetical protein